MTTTAYDDQFSAEPEPVHQPYDVAEILRQNIADLEKEIQRQKERAEKAEAELNAAREQEPELCAQLCEWLPVSTGWEVRTFAEAIRGIGLGGELSNGFSPFNPIPVPAAPAPTVAASTGCRRSPTAIAVFTRGADGVKTILLMPAKWLTQLIAGAKPAPYCPVAASE